MLSALLAEARRRYAAGEVKGVCGLPPCALDIFYVRVGLEEMGFILGATPREVEEALEMLDECTPDGRTFSVWFEGGAEVRPMRYEYGANPPHWEVLGVMALAMRRAQALELVRPHLEAVT